MDDARTEAFLLLCMLAQKLPEFCDRRSEVTDDELETMAVVLATAARTCQQATVTKLDDYRPRPPDDGPQRIG